MMMTREGWGEHEGVSLVGVQVRRQVKVVRSNALPNARVPNPTFPTGAPPGAAPSVPAPRRALRTRLSLAGAF